MLESPRFRFNFNLQGGGTPQFFPTIRSVSGGVVGVSHHLQFHDVSPQYNEINYSFGGTSVNQRDYFVALHS